MAIEGAERRRRGRPPRPEPAEPSGYRLTGATRREIDIARGFFNFSSNQQLIDEAVRSFLRRLRQTNSLYASAVEGLTEKINDEISDEIDD